MHSTWFKIYVLIINNHILGLLVDPQSERSKTSFVTKICEQSIALIGFSLWYRYTSGCTSGKSRWNVGNGDGLWSTNRSDKIAGHVSPRNNGKASKGYSHCLTQSLICLTESSSLDPSNQLANCESDEAIMITKTHRDTTQLHTCRLEGGQWPWGSCEWHTLY